MFGMPDDMNERVLELIALLFSNDVSMCGNTTEGPSAKLVVYLLKYGDLDFVDYSC